MAPFFDFAPLDPACNPPERYQAAFELLAELWGRVRGFRSLCDDDPLLAVLIARLEHEIVAAGVVLGVQIELVSRR
ncbi:hypothetical protein ACIPUD_24170 [Bradyrhizobium sp. CAR08]